MKNKGLPTAEELERLPLRAIVAYAARTANRISSELRGVIADDILDDALRLVVAVSTASDIGKVDAASLIRASERFTSAYANAPLRLRSKKKLFIVTSLIHAALAGMDALIAAEDFRREPENVRYQMRCAAQSAERATRPIKALTPKAAQTATEAARKDYDILLREYGEHEEVVIGEPVHCFGNY